MHLVHVQTVSHIQWLFTSVNNMEQVVKGIPQQTRLGFGDSPSSGSLATEWPVLQSRCHAVPQSPVYNHCSPSPGAPLTIPLSSSHIDRRELPAGTWTPVVTSSILKNLNKSNQAKIYNTYCQKTKQPTSARNLNDCLSYWTLYRYVR